MTVPGLEPLPVCAGSQSGFRRGQAMLETALAVLFITIIFLMVFQAAHTVTAKILLDHAAARAARAKSVGFNDWMCLKSARVAMIPVAGERTWPEGGGAMAEASFVPAYMQTENVAMADGILEYDGWREMDVSVRSGVGSEIDARVSLDMPRFYSRGDGDSDAINVEGEARIESHFPLYMFDQGL